MRTGMFTVFGVFIVFATGMVWPPCLAGPANGSAVYRTTDANGNPMFSDRPVGQDAVVVEIGPINTISAPPPTRHDEGRARPGDNIAFGYRLLKISSPKDGATLRDPRKPLPVEVRILPALRSGDKIQLLDNGAVLSGRVLDAPQRGLHVLRAQVLDEAGKVVMRSPSISVHVHRAAVSPKKGGQGHAPVLAIPGVAAQPAFSR